MTTIRFLTILGLLATVAHFARAAEPLPVFWPAPQFKLTDQNGTPFSSDALKGHTWVADFIFTNCAGPCPLMTNRMVELSKKVTDPNVRFVSFTVDPERDTPEVLKQYAAARGATDPRWSFLTGPKEDIFRIAAEMKLGAMPGNASHAIIHSDRFTLVDKLNQVRGTYRPLDGDGWDKLLAETAILLAEGSPGAVTTAPAISPEREAMIRRFPAINASLNATSGFLICLGLVLIKARRVRAHTIAMIAALISSAAFLACYVTYHYLTGGKPTVFPQSSLKPVYLAILLSHTVLAVVVLPMVIMTVWRAATRQWERHKRLARPTFWIWLYVSVTGVVVYWMLYHLAPTIGTAS